MKRRFSKEDLESWSKEELILLILQLQEEIEQLWQEVEMLKQKMNLPTKDSHNSSLPPSLDKKGLIKKEGEVKKGPPFGHAGKSRERKGKVDMVVVQKVKECPICHQPIHSESDDYVSHQILELPPLRLFTIEILRQRTTCPRCGETVIAPLPEGIKGHQTFGKFFEALVVYLHYRQHIPQERIKEMVEELFGEKISDGVIENILNRAGERLEDEYKEIGALLQEAEVVGGDETGWRIGGGNGWLWHFQNGEAAYYKVDESRSGEVAKGVLGEEFDGILLTDFWGGYNRVKAKKQKCLSHLLRDIKYGREVEKQSESEEGWCGRLEEVIKEAIEIGKSRQGMGEEEYWQAVERVEAELDRLLIEDVRSEEGRKLRKRLLKYRGEIFTFLYVEGVPFNNNGSERGIRKAVIHRKISGGSRSDEGAKRFGVIMSVIETMRKRREEILTGLVARLGGKDLEIIHCHSP